MNKKYLFALLIIYFFCAINWASAISIGVRPIKIDAEVKIGQRMVAEILIKNTESEPALYKIYADKYRRNIKIIPSEFKLDSNEEMVVKVVSTFWLPGRKNADISIVARPLDASSTLSLPGVKMAFSVKVSFGYLFFGALLAALVGLVFVVKFILAKRISNN